MWFDKIKLSYKKLCAKTIYLDKSESSPIIFDDYNENDYYYVINDNYNHIYSQDELYEILKMLKLRGKTITLEFSEDIRKIRECYDSIREYLE